MANTTNNITVSTSADVTTRGLQQATLTPECAGVNKSGEDHLLRTDVTQTCQTPYNTSPVVILQIVIPILSFIILALLVFIIKSHRDAIKRHLSNRQRSMLPTIQQINIRIRSLPKKSTKVSGTSALLS